MSADEGFNITDAPAGQGNLGPVPAGAKRGRKKRSDAGQQRYEGTPRRKLPKVDPKEVYELVGFPVVMADQGAQLFSKFWRDNALTGTEIGELTKALGDEAMSHKAVLKYLQGLSANAVHIRLAMVLTKIAIPRMGKAGLLPEEVANVFANVGATDPEPATETRAESESGNRAAVPDRTGGTHELHGSNGERQVNGAGSRVESGSVQSWERTPPETVQATATEQEG